MNTSAARAVCVTLVLALVAAWAHVVIASDENIAEPAMVRQTLAPGDASQRLMVFFFDTSAMAPEQATRALAAARAWVEQAMTSEDSVAVVAINPALRVVSDFTLDRDQLRAALQEVAALPATDPQAAGINEARLKAIATVCQTVATIPKKKSMLYFSSGIARNDGSSSELRSATNTCNRGNVSVYPVDARGLADPATPITTPGLPAGASAKEGARGLFR